jgi:hypothetical protein
MRLRKKTQERCKAQATRKLESREITEIRQINIDKNTKRRDVKTRNIVALLPCFLHPTPVLNRLQLKFLNN